MGGNMFFWDIHSYKNREEAGHLLAASLDRYADMNGVVLAIPRGGVPIGYIIATALNFKLDLALSKKIGHPLHKEYAIGAVSLTDSFVEDNTLVSSRYIEQEISVIRARLREMYRMYMGANHTPEALSGKTVILTDDGLATGQTMLSTIQMVKTHHPNEIIVAVPVASQSSIDLLSARVDVIICPLVPDIFKGVGEFYEDFKQLSDEDVMEYIQRYNKTINI